MAEPNPGFQASEGSPEQLPRGAAEAANEGTNVVAQEPLVLDQEPVEQGAEELAPEDMATEADFDPQYVPSTDDEKFLTRPTERPDEGQFVGAAMPRGQSPTVRRHLSLLQEAASAPGASAQLKALVSYLIRTA